MPIPKLIAGELPPGVHKTSLDEISKSFGSTNDRRKLLMVGLIRAAQNFKAGGVGEIYVDGSFTTAKELPNDVDGCWSAIDADPASVDPVFWKFDSPQEFEQVNRKQMKDKYHLDFYVAEWPSNSQGRPFPDYFQTNRSGEPKGILLVDLSKEDS